MRHFDNRTLTVLKPMFIVQWKRKKLEPVSYKSLLKLNLRGDFHKIVLSSQKSNFPVYYASQSSHPALNSLTHPALTWMSSENFFPNNLATHKYSWTPLDLSLQKHWSRSLFQYLWVCVKANVSFEYQLSAAAFVTFLLVPIRLH